MEKSHIEEYLESLDNEEIISVEFTCSKRNVAQTIFNDFNKWLELKYNSERLEEFNNDLIN